MNNAECPPLEAILNGTMNVINRVREGHVLSGDVISYSCDDGFRFHEGADSDYVYECQEDGSWSNSRDPICVKSLFIRSSIVVCLFYI